MGTGSYLPSRRIGNDALAPLVGCSSADIERETGITSRRYADSDETASELALHASIEALRMADCSAASIDCIVFATQSPDYAIPGSGCVLGAKLGLVGVAALDVRAQAAGFLWGLSLADHLVRLGTYRTVLVVGAEAMSPLVEWTPRGRHAAVTFGDGAAAVLLVSEAEETRGVLATGLHSDGRFARMHMMPSAGTPPDRAAPLRARFPVPQRPEETHEAKRHARDMVATALSSCGLAAGDVALVIESLGPPEVVAEACRYVGISPTRVSTPRRSCGDLVAAALPFGLDTAIRNALVGPGDTLLLCAFGSGFSWGWAVLRL